MIGDSNVFLLVFRVSYFLVVYNCRFDQYCLYLLKDLVISLVLKYQWSKRFFLFELLYIWVNGWAMPVFLFPLLKLLRRATSVDHYFLFFSLYGLFVKYCWTFETCIHGPLPALRWYWLWWMRTNSAFMWDPQIPLATGLSLVYYGILNSYVTYW